jgi:hypothetical protein
MSNSLRNRNLDSDRCQLLTLSQPPMRCRELWEKAIGPAENERLLYSSAFAVLVARKAIDNGPVKTRYGEFSPDCYCIVVRIVRRAIDVPPARLLQ